VQNNNPGGVADIRTEYIIPLFFNPGGVAEISMPIGCRMVNFHVGW
jgi:hypothetical protein